MLPVKSFFLSRHSALSFGLLSAFYFATFEIMDLKRRVMSVWTKIMQVRLSPPRYMRAVSLPAFLRFLGF